ncbi:helix-turn-helix domain-containing protein [Comamonas sp. MYb396]|uniref:helix-turn-helix domain-containing protein n=1 Tax=Comamonas sp. MYb396 TaxID=2745302 RepID=UPI0030950F31
MYCPAGRGRGRGCGLTNHWLAAIPYHARRCGFADASHFVRAFHQATGMTPGHWRQNRGADGTLAP